MDFKRVIINDDEFNIRATYNARGSKIYYWIDFPTYTGAWLSTSRNIKTAFKYGIDRCKKQLNNPKNNYNWQAVINKLENILNNEP